MVVTGARSEDDAQLASRKIVRILQRIGVPAQFSDFGVQNLVGVGDCGFPIRLEGIADSDHARFCSVR